VQPLNNNLTSILHVPMIRNSADRQVWPRRSCWPREVFKASSSLRESCRAKHPRVQGLCGALCSTRGTKMGDRCGTRRTLHAPTMHSLACHALDATGVQFGCVGTSRPSLLSQSLTIIHSLTLSLDTITKHHHSLVRFTHCTRSLDVGTQHKPLTHLTL
jgi:hypothetical protein